MLQDLQEETTKVVLIPTRWNTESMSVLMGRSTLIDIESGTYIGPGGWQHFNYPGRWVLLEKLHSPCTKHVHASLGVVYVEWYSQILHYQQGVNWTSACFYRRKSWLAIAYYYRYNKLRTCRWMYSWTCDDREINWHPGGKLLKSYKMR
jgi:hypothetical protein